jgi:hypothetical protein
MSDTETEEAPARHTKAKPKQSAAFLTVASGVGQTHSPQRSSLPPPPPPHCTLPRTSVLPSALMENAQLSVLPELAKLAVEPHSAVVRSISLPLPFVGLTSASALTSAAASASTSGIALSSVSELQAPPLPPAHVRHTRTVSAGAIPSKAVAAYASAPASVSAQEALHAALAVRERCFQLCLI